MGWEFFNAKQIIPALSYDLTTRCSPIFYLFLSTFIILAYTILQFRIPLQFPFYCPLYFKILTNNVKCY